MTVQDAIAAAESVLPGHTAPEGEIDLRWQAIIAVGKFVEANPEAVWSFVRRWGSSADEDVRMAVATCVLEHLLEHHFDDFMSRVEQVARADGIFGDTVAHCWTFGQSDRPDHAARFERLVISIRERTGQQSE